MWKLRQLFSFLLLLCSAAALVAARGFTSKWQTLNGYAPLVVARGGFSGLFPDSSKLAYAFAVETSLPNTVLWCDVQLTKDAVGICFPDVKLDNGSDINLNPGFKKNTYVVNGVSTTGWFSVDFTFKEVQSVNLIQGIGRRTLTFDGISGKVLTVQDVATQVKPPGFWLNAQHDAFFTQHNLSMRSFIISASRSVVVNYISSPEVNFLRSIVQRFRQSAIKLVFQFLGPQEVEPSTSQTYGSLLKNLTFIKTFASAILVPKYYIWPLDSKQYLLPSSTSRVLDAHKEGLEVYASEFGNDGNLAYNYSYDPLAEYLSFFDNGKFSVDGVLSDFPITPSSAIDCFSHLGKNETVQAKVVVISREGASGDYPGCTDMAYNKAISDGADIIDCPVQMTQDGIPFCLGSINLIERTTAARSSFTNLKITIPELNVQDGICAFNLTWNQIQDLQPLMYNTYANYSLYRNPAFSNAGNFIQLSDFLALANNASSVSGVLISIENAGFLAENGLGVVDAVLDTLNKSIFSNQTSKKVMIASTDSQVLMKFGKNSSYELVYRVGEDIRGMTNSTILEIKKFARSVIISKISVFPTDKEALLTGMTEVVPKLQALNLAAYVEIFSNGFVSLAWDFFSDPYVEINLHVSGMGINGVVTDYPATAAKYKRNRCLGYKEVEIPPYMKPFQPGFLRHLMVPAVLPPAKAPNPILTENDVIEAPLPPVAVRSPTTNSGNGTSAPGPTTPSGQSTLVASTFLSTLAILLVTCTILKF